MLTDREKQIIEQVLEGKTSEGVGKSLFISKRTVEKVKNQLIFKLGCTNFYEVIGICFRKGWVK